jgi:transposase
MARLRHQTFFTLAALNQQIRFLLDDLNSRPFKKLPGTRLSQFEALDKPAIKPLPRSRFQFTAFKLARVNIDYHLEYEKHYYSVPHHLVKHQVEVQATRDSVVVFFKGKQIARHARNNAKGGYTTDANHMPTAHRKHKEWSPERLLDWAKDLGPNVQLMTQVMLHRKPHPEQAYRACLGLLNLSRTYDKQRLDAACQRAAAIHSPTIRSIKSILKNGIDQLELSLDEQRTATEKTSSDDHDNIRGSQYYH